MIESPWLKEIIEEREAEQLRKDIMGILAERFGKIDPEVPAALQSISDSVRLQELLRLSVRCSDLDAFRARLQS